MPPRERWRALVEHARRDHAPVAATCEHARLIAFDRQTVAIEFEPRFMDLFEQGDRASTLAALLADLFGPEWTLKVDFCGAEDASTDAPVAAGDPTLYEEREADLVERQVNLQRDLEQHPLVEKARQLFDPAKERTAVELFDE